MTSKPLQITLDVASQSQAAELNAAWQEIVAGQRVRLNTAAEDLNDIMERARTALQRITNAIETNPGTGQSRRLVRFLAGVYNGSDFPFDLTDLRALDTELANACIDYLNYDRLAKAEVHTHLPGGGKQMQSILRDAGIQPSPRFSVDDAHKPRLFALAERKDRHVDEFVREAIEDLLSRDEAKTFGGLLATQPSPDGDRSLIHARNFSDTATKPLCGATDGPWTARGFDFLRLTCRDCQSLVLEPPDDPA
jgi:hypothetical protein